jgi:mono/diheme cytochrome c family protein
MNSRLLLGLAALGLASTVSMRALPVTTASAVAGTAAAQLANGPIPDPSRRALLQQPVISPSAASPAPQAVVTKYCVTCHNDRTRSGSLSLQGVDAAAPATHPEVWERVIKKLRNRAMPPVGMPRPDEATYVEVVAYLEGEIDREAVKNPNPGRPSSVHRLNRTEYANAIRDLLALDVDVRALLPADDENKGFDNIADALSVSPTLLDRYLVAARKVSQLAVGDPGVQSSLEVFRTSKTLRQDERMSEEMSFGTRGGVAKTHHFPLDGEYVVRVRLQRNLYGYIRGLNEAHQMDVRLDGVLLKRFSVGGEAPGKMPAASFSGGNRRRGGQTEEFNRVDKYMLEADKDLEVRFPAKAGDRVLSVAFVERPFEAEGVLQPPITFAGFDFSEMPDSNPGVERVELAGPYSPTGAGETASRKRIFPCRPVKASDEAACARTVVTRLARLAFRHSPSTADVNTLMGFYRSARTDGDFDSGIRAALERILIDPQFMFRIEQDPATPGSRAYAVSDIELASRLSFFLWSSIPDTELLDAAERGRLSNPTILNQQVRRMLADPRAESLVSNFAAQWLLVRNMRGVTPDQVQFPEFDDNLRNAFMQETELFLQSQVSEDRPVTDLLSASYTFVNDRLAEHYGIPGVYGTHFRKITIPASNPRAGLGLLGQGSVLTVTSLANRTSPVLRGKWFLENMLGTPPPPPPPNVPPLMETVAGKKPTSVRERLELHRSNPVCSACHSQMDPLGFAMEHFDAIGGYRSTGEGGAPIDSSGMLPDGRKFQDASDLNKLLLERKPQFVQAVVDKMLIYALGRGLEDYDRPAIRRIEKDAAMSQYRWSSLVLGIVQSVPFRMRRSAS